MGMVPLVRTSVILDHKIQLLAEEKYRRLYHDDINYSAFFRSCLESWVYSADDPRPIWQQTSEIVERIKKDLHAQKTLLSEEESLKFEKERREAERKAAIDRETRAAVKKLAFKPEWLRDPRGLNYSHHRKEITDEVSFACRVDLQWKDLMPVVSAIVLEGSEVKA
jgi:hypothetical protein